MSWYRWDGDDLHLTLHVQPRAARPGIAGLHDGALKLKVRAAPEAGRANSEIVRLLADAFSVAPSAVAVLRGATGRRKQVRISGPHDVPGDPVLGEIVRPG